jgi:hypothetical protein
LPVFRRDKAVENVVVARQMQRFFKALPAKARKDPSRVAKEYGKHLFHRRRRELVKEKQIAASRFHVGIGVGAGDFDRLTKRAVLISDTLLLSHNGRGKRHQITRLSLDTWDHDPPDDQWGGGRLSGWSGTQEDLQMRCPDLEVLGRWLLDTEPLLCAGSAWYLPTYVTSKQTFNMPGAGLLSEGIPEGSGPERQSQIPGLLDFLHSGRRAVAQSSAPAVTCQVVRPVINDLELPFLDGVPTEAFSKITMDEFDAYRSFRGWLRRELLNLDPALDAVHSERELMKISHEIQDGIREVRAQMNTVRRKRAVAMSGAVVGTVSAGLVAVYGPAFQSAVAAVVGGAAGGLWGAFQASADNNPRDLQGNQHYYVWTLSRHDTGTP